MASATARPTFFFRIQTLPPPSKPKSHLPIPLFRTTKPIIFSPPGHIKTILSTSSIDVSKEDKPISEKPEALQATESPPTDEEKKQFDPRRLEERFAVLNTGIYECRSCGYKYDETVGDPSYPIPPGLSFSKLPDDWRCPTCGAAQTFFESKRVEIAGFAQNQQFGLGGNTLTSGQKALLIYGSLFFAFLLFLSGYFLQ
ncbi:hypothetical protein ACLOJK_015762 [Asimina triloba]